MNCAEIFCTNQADIKIYGVRPVCSDCDKSIELNIRTPEKLSEYRREKRILFVDYEPDMPF